jgi:hypothetical protein
MNCLVAKRGGALLAAVRGSLHRHRATGRCTSTLHISKRVGSVDATTEHFRTGLYLVLASFVFGCTGTTRTVVEAEERPLLSSKISSKTDAVTENPLLSGVSDRDIQAFFEQVLADSSMNVKGIPDVLEAELYRMTVRLVLDMVYSSIGAMHGMEFLAGHQIELKRRRETADEAATSLLFFKENSGIDDAILEQVADRLLQNKAVNYTAVPDFVERQIYSNCLKLVFRLLDTLANTFCITICGHELRIYFDPIRDNPSMMVDRLAAITTAVAAPSAKSRINIEVLTAQLSNTSSSLFQQQVLLSVYTLVLSIIDDVLANSEIKLLYDRVSFDVVAREQGDTSNDNDDDKGNGVVAVDQKLQSGGGVPVALRGTVATSSAIFTTGVVVGAVATFFLGSHRR